MIRIVLSLAVVLAAAVAALALLSSPAGADGNCANHYPYKVIDGHSRSHDRDGDGVGCESNPLWPSQRGDPAGPTTTTGTGYNRANWGYDSSAARARLGCSSDEHVDHIVALKEAYDSGAASWTNARKREFANDPLNQWCLLAGLNLSKSDGDLAEWSGGSCEQRQHIAIFTISVKAKYSLAVDAAEQRANAAAMQATCSTSSSSSTTQDLDMQTGATVSEATISVRISARLLDDGRIEFALQLEDGTRLTPRVRFLPRNARANVWYRSSPLELIP